MTVVGVGRKRLKADQVCPVKAHFFYVDGGSELCLTDVFFLMLGCVGNFLNLIISNLWGRWGANDGY